MILASLRVGLQSLCRPVRIVANNLSRIEQAQRIERIFDGMLHSTDLAAELCLHSATLEKTDAVLAGHRPAEFDRRVKKIIDSSLSGPAGVVVARWAHQQGMNVAVAGMRDRRDLDSMLGTDLLDTCQHQWNGRSRDAHILGQEGT